MANSTALAPPSEVGMKRRGSSTPACAGGTLSGGAGGTLSGVAWRAREGMSYSDWVAQGRKLGVLGRSAGWWIGDWLNYGNVAYEERYVRAARITGYDVQTLMNMTYVASAIDPSRRRENLSWSHHAEVAGLDPEAQTRLLDRAERERMSGRDRRQEIRRARRLEKAEQEAGPPPAAPPARPEPSQGEEVCCPECGHSFAAAQPAAVG
jgi:hypothetical protein